MLYQYKKAIIALVYCVCTTVSFAQITSRQWFDKAEQLFKDKSYEEAAVAYDKAAAIDPKNETAFYMAGWCYNDLDKFSNAIDRLKKAVALKSTDHQAWQELGFAYKKTSKNEEALSCLNKAIAIKPTYSLAYKQLGDVYQNMGKKADAITAYKKCNDNDKENYDACYNLGYLYNGMEQYSLALEWLNKASVIKETVEAWNETGFAYYKLKNNDEAINAYKSALKLNSANGTAYKGMGDVYRLNYKPAKVDDAISSYLKAIENNPKSSGSHYGLGWCYNEKNNFEQAIPMLIKSIELDRTFAAGYVELGYAQYMTGKYPEGLNTLKAGLAQDNKNKLCRYYSGLIYIKQGDKTNATAMYNELKPLDDKLAEKLLAKINAL
ncbi:MAG: tetratricopeptide repeat protein [Ferruginibacter sp.]